MKPTPAQRRVLESMREDKTLDHCHPFTSVGAGDDEIYVCLPTFRALLARQWIELLPGRNNEYTLSDAGRKAIGEEKS